MNNYVSKHIKRKSYTRQDENKKPIPVKDDPLHFRNDDYILSDVSITGQGEVVYIYSKKSNYTADQISHMENFTLEQIERLEKKILERWKNEKDRSDNKRTPITEI